MKLSILFAKYLYEHKVLNLPGIGVFSIDPSIPVPEHTDRNIQDFIKQIRYEQKPVAKPDDSFIDFIRTHTGKIRPLAESDLESFISDGKIMLNIGKPFYFEGIGSLMKTRQGTYEFIPGQPLTDHWEHQRETISPTEISESTRPSEWEKITPSTTNSARKILIIIAILAGLAAVIWGGYLMYNRNSGPGSQATDQNLPISGSDNTAREDTSRNLINTSDTHAIAQQPAAVLPTGETNYKFIIESTTSKARAMRRYEQLKSYLLDIHMDTPLDSSSFKLYFQFPALPSDTNHIKDSLQRMYGSRKIVIEK